MMGRVNCLGIRQGRWVFSSVLMVLLLAGLAGCSKNQDCINCVDLPPPVVPTGVHSISGDNMILVQWYDIAYAPYDGSYNPNIDHYVVYSRFYQPGDELNPNREFFNIGEVAWDENLSLDSGLHWFSDDAAVNGDQYEYAVAAVNAAGRESALSFEFVADAPLPMSPLDAQGWYTPVRVEDANGLQSARSGFDFRRAALAPDRLDAGVVDPSIGFHIQVSIESGVAYVVANGASTELQDLGVFAAPGGHLVFEGVSWAPDSGYSRTGRLELVTGHIYVVRITTPATGEVHYAKFGIDRINFASVDLIWAYQLIPGLDELSVPENRGQAEPKLQLIKL